jgi:hypothetical protein
MSSVCAAGGVSGNRFDSDKTTAAHGIARLQVSEPSTDQHVLFSQTSCTCSRCTTFAGKVIVCLHLMVDGFVLVCNDLSSAYLYLQLADADWDHPLDPRGVSFDMHGNLRASLGNWDNHTKDQRLLHAKALACERSSQQPVCRRWLCQMLVLFLQPPV